MELKIQSLSKKFKDKIAVDNFSITLEKGIYGLLGPNGSGKSTLMRMLADVVYETEGNIYLNGKDKRIMGEEYRDIIGYLPQDIGFYGSFTAEKFLYYVSALKGIDKKDAKERIDDLLTFVNLQKDRKRKIKGFSGGMKQRLGIAQALLNDPKILILDDPPAGLDPTERIRFKNLISRLSKDKIVILSTHIVSDLESLANEIIIMSKGKLVEKDTPYNLVEKIRGRVWKAEVSDEELSKLSKDYKIAKTFTEGNSIKVRFVGDKKPNIKTFEEEPDLEDMFLYYFGEEGGEEYDRAN